jgi:hypothetical protein
MQDMSNKRYKSNRIPKAKARRRTQLEAEGAEFLVVGEFLIRGIPAYKNYTKMPGYDVIAINPAKNKSVRISVKSRWATDANGFIIGNFDCDFVVVAKLNRGSTSGLESARPPEFFVFPVDVVRTAPRSKSWNRVTFGSIPNFRTYRDKWDLVGKFLGISIKP